ncbi:MAG: hypothetical protein RLZZ455_1167 [Candidatus Parcubacteria bacterium]|jgi:tetratricopeptide (TPR) repeat protein
MTSIKLQAIQTALNGDWQNAIELNTQILKETPEDIDALNRIGFAYASMGNLKLAKSSYQKVLALDAQNPIALKNLKKLSGHDGKTIPTISFVQMNNIFIEEPGKTKVIELLNVADQKAIGKLRCGETIALQVKRMRLFVLDQEKQYIGMLPDDLSKRLIKFINGGNHYEAYVKTVNNHKVAIFIKETKRAARFRNQPSFATSDKSRFVLENTARKSDKSHDKEDDDISDESGYADGGNEESF